MLNVIFHKAWSNALKSATSLARLAKIVSLKFTSWNQCYRKVNILKENYKTVKPYMAVLQRQGSVQRRASQGQYEDEQAKHFHPIVQKWKRQGLRIINLLNQNRKIQAWSEYLWSFENNNGVSFTVKTNPTRNFN